MGNVKSNFAQTTQPLQNKSVVYTPIDRTNQILLTHKIANSAFHFMPPRMAGVFFLKKFKFRVKCIVFCD
jgi:hypothetical protein